MNSTEPSTTTRRPIHKIAAEAAADWSRPYFGAVPYLDAMASLDAIADQYGNDSGKEIVMYFLANAATWRGDVARRIKRELNGLLKPVVTRRRAYMRR